ncbi:RNA degradosome polyphosphate kinase [Bacillus sp. JJ1764]|uniref:RNA degradosome polyphosphate kinase n=1 Tax=Bacillus sp. JJ1764 TaxID=3122964 RepID=UPI002FFDF14C
MKTLYENAVKLSGLNYFNNREISWLDFNGRVLEEALDERNPLLERLKYLSIFSSNLDEFFMVRVARLKNQAKAGKNRSEKKGGLSSSQQLKVIGEKVHSLVHLQYDTYNKILIPNLFEEKIEILKIRDLNPEQIKDLENYFDEQIFPVLTPMAVDAYHRFPMLLNKSINLAVALNHKTVNEETYSKVALVEVPSFLERFIPVNSASERMKFILLEDLISYFISKLFIGYEIVSVTAFRITRNADLTLDEEEAQDLLKDMEKELKKRKWGMAVRLEIQHTGFPSHFLHYLMDKLEIGKNDVYEIDGPLDLTMFLKLYSKLEHHFDHLVYDHLIPHTPQDLLSGNNIFEKISERDILLHHPYDSFEPVIEFISKASVDPDVLAIKQTLYRVSGHSPIIEALKRAAENGKQVTVLVELKARFDEQKNVQWSKELEDAGCHVIYGMSHLKTHSKITLIVRKKKNRIERFVHLGTGNYNDQTAKLYTDFSLFTSKRKFGIDATNFFNYLSGYTDKPMYNHLSVAPFDIRKDFIELINEEITFQKRYGNGYIIAKMNSLSDKKIIMKLYEASIAGVKIDLIVRGICCVRPGIKGVSENIRVRSIVGKFLEHSRIYYFRHNGEEKTFLSSADMMTRNLDKRVEILFPIFDGNIKLQLNHILRTLLADNVKAREQDHEGHYHYVKRSMDEPEIDSQLVLSKAHNESYLSIGNNILY